MAKFEIGALDEYLEKLNNITDSQRTRVIIGASLYEGAKIATDEIRKEIDKFPTVDNSHYGMTKEEKEALQEGLGIAQMQYVAGDYNVKVGFDGYAKKKTKKHPKGIPIPLIARSFISGTSFRPKNDFVRRAVNRVRKKTIDKMNETINEKIKKEME